MKSKAEKEKIKTFVLSIFIVFGMSLNLTLQKDYSSNMFSITTPSTMLILVMGVYFLINNIKDKAKKDYLLILLSFIIACIQIACYFFYKYDSINNAYATPYQIFKVMVYIISFSFLFYYIIKSIKYYVSNVKFKKTKNKILIKLFDEHPVFYSTLILLVVYSIMFFIYYPGNVANDFYDEMSQYNHYETFTVTTINLINENQYINGHHSPFHTFVSGFLNEVGSKLVDINFGLFLSIIPQVILAIIAFSYVFKLLKELKIPYFCRVFILALFILFPTFNINIFTAVKDLPYSLLLLLFTCLLIEFVYLKKYDWKTVLKFIVVGLLMSLLAKKGFYVLILTTLGLFIVYIKNNKKLALILLIPLFLYTGYDKVILPYFDITPGSIREMLAIPIQQIGRTVAYHSDELSNDEQEIIGNILDYDELPELYNPDTADTIKNRHFNKNYTSEELKEFLVLYVKLFFKYPGTYISAFFNQTCGYYDLMYNSSSMSYWTISSARNESIEEISYERVGWRENVTEKIQKLYVILRKIPLIDLLFNLGFYFWLSVLVLIYTFKSYKLKGILPLIPLLVTLLFVFISPANYNFRYIMPITYMMVVIIPYVYSLNRKKEKNYEERSKRKIRKREENSGINTLL